MQYCLLLFGKSKNTAIRNKKYGSIKRNKNHDSDCLQRNIYINIACSVVQRKGENCGV